jgi:hypothetical protein
MEHKKLTWDNLELPDEDFSTLHADLKHSISHVKEIVCLLSPHDLLHDCWNRLIRFSANLVLH